jgi:putative lipoprotein
VVSWCIMTVRERLLAVLWLLLLAPLSARGEVPGLVSQDDWFGQDKLLHFGISGGLAGVGYTGGALLFDAPQARWLTGAGVALGMGLGKEIHDAGRGGLFSFKDLTWDVLGTGTGLALSWAVERLFFPPEEPTTPVGAERQELVRVSALKCGGVGLPGGGRFTLTLSLGARGHPQEVPGSGRNTPVMLLLMGGW